MSKPSMFRFESTQPEVRIGLGLHASEQRGLARTSCWRALPNLLPSLDRSVVDPRATASQHLTLTTAAADDGYCARVMTEPPASLTVSCDRREFTGTDYHVGQTSLAIGDKSCVPSLASVKRSRVEPTGKVGAWAEKQAPFITGVRH